MAVRTTVDIPEPLHDKLRQRAHQSRSSIRSLIIKAIEQTYGSPAKKERLTGPLIMGKKLGPLFPTDENPYDLFLP
jgi:hypothetical protein